jgi:hypothetical protein
VARTLIAIALASICICGCKKESSTEQVDPATLGKLGDPYSISNAQLMEASGGRVTSSKYEPAPNAGSAAQPSQHTPEAGGH